MKTVSLKPHMNKMINKIPLIPIFITMYHADSEDAMHKGTGIIVLNPTNVFEVAHDTLIEMTKQIALEVKQTVTENNTAYYRIAFQSGGLRLYSFYSIRPYSLVPLNPTVIEQAH